MTAPVSPATFGFGIVGVGMIADYHAQAIHAIDLLQWFAGMPSEVFCWTTRRVYGHIEAEDTASAALKFPDPVRIWW